jgi:hypothetical protein
MKVFGVLAAIAVSVLTACTPYNIANEFAAFGRPASARDIDPSELYWNPAVISNSNCPDINGEFLIPKGDLQKVGLNVKIIDYMSNGSKPILYDSTLSVKSIPEGIAFVARNEIDNKVGNFEFSNKFGCANGEYVIRYTAGYSGGSESGTCIGVMYSEVHWHLDRNQNLVISLTQRNPCWLERGKNNQRSEKILPPILLKRIGDVSYCNALENVTEQKYGRER